MLWLQAVLLTSVLAVQGLPTVEEGSYEYSDYGEGDYESEEEGKGYSSLTPSITSQPVSTSVDEGMTIRLPCSVDNLPDDIPIIWRKEDAAQTTIAVGGLIVAAEYRDRASASNNNRGSTLKIGIANAEDAGQYRCEVAVQGKDRPQLSHTVRIIAQSGQPPQSGPGAKSAVLTAGSTTPAAALLTLLLAGLVWL